MSGRMERRGIKRVGVNRRAAIHLRLFEFQSTTAAP